MLGIPDCPKWLASEIWAVGEELMGKQQNTASHFEAAWKKHMGSGRKNWNGAWVPHEW